VRTRQGPIAAPKERNVCVARKLQCDGGTMSTDDDRTIIYSLNLRINFWFCLRVSELCSGAVLYASCSYLLFVIYTGRWHEQRIKCTALSELHLSNGKRMVDEDTCKLGNIREKKTIDWVSSIIFGPIKGVHNNLVARCQALTQVTHNMQSIHPFQSYWSYMFVLNLVFYRSYKK
jgi:hypothetical protein